jgi:hypothetical protein
MSGTNKLVQSSLVDSSISALTEGLMNANEKAKGAKSGAKQGKKSK